MSADRTDDRDLVADLRAGNESAARELFDRYCERLMRLARRRIGQRMLARVDPEDVIQSAFRTFFVHVRNDEFTFDGADDMFKLLVRLTVRKALRQIAYHRAAKRNPEKEAQSPDPDHDLMLELVSSGPTPDMEVALLNEFEEFVAKLPPLDRKVLEMRLQGYSSAEIAAAVGSYERKVRRVLEKIHALAEGKADAEAQG
jgi:RNA polymerase sigma-70 factor (ECF subfamily)